MEYLTTLIFVFLVSMILKLKYKIRLFNSAKEGLLLAFLLLVVGGLWDSYAILRGFWSFEEEFFIGIDIGVMPLEESFHDDYSLSGAGALSNCNEKELPLTPSLCNVNCPKRECVELFSKILKCLLEHIYDG